MCIYDEIDGMVLTNHYKSIRIKEPFKTWRQRYIDEYRRTKEYGDAYLIRAFFGADKSPSGTPNRDDLIIQRIADTDKKLLDLMNKCKSNASDG